MILGHIRSGGLAGIVVPQRGVLACQHPSQTFPSRPTLGAGSSFIPDPTVRHLRPSRTRSLQARQALAWHTGRHAFLPLTRTRPIPTQQVNRNGNGSPEADVP